ncbi:MAG: ROK family protein [Oscillospiraceae bacterium]|nr:ROK family protein [Oscillospiraceae bacterium]
MKEIQKAAVDTAGISKLDLKRQNRMYILRCLRNSGSACRVDLAEGTGLTKAAVTIIVNEMIGDGVLRETGEQPPAGDGKAARGRKKILVDINETYRLAMGLLLDGGQITLGLCTLKGRTVEKQSSPLPKENDPAAILDSIRRMYDDIVYKNDLHPEMLTGLGVCVSSEYHNPFGITADSRGVIDYSPLERELKQICSLPMAFGTVAEGVAVAEIDLRPAGEVPPMNAVVLRTDSDLDTAVIICRELYRGSTGRPASLLKMNSSPAYKVLRGYVLDRIRQAGIEKGYNFVQQMFRRDLTDPMKLFCSSSFRPSDSYHIALLNEIEEAYYWMYDFLLRAYAPDRLILIGETGVERAVERALRRINKQFPQCEGGIIRRSLFRDFDLYKGAAALAVREFFIDRGGL